MKCPFCSHPDTQVIDSRPSSEEGDVVRRRRSCANCGKRFTTYERIELSFPALIKRDGSRSDYSRGKLRASFALALRKRAVSAELVDHAISAIEDQLLASASKEVSTEYIGELVMQQLKQLDTVAYIRFASVYKSFEDLQAFSEEIAQLTQPKIQAKTSRKTPVASNKRSKAQAQ